MKQTIYVIISTRYTVLFQLLDQVTTDLRRINYGAVTIELRYFDSAATVQRHSNYGGLWISKPN